MSIFPLSVCDSEFLIKSRECDFSDGWNKNMLNSAFNGGRFYGFTVKDKEKTVGYITYSKGIDDIDIESVFILPDYRRKGLAKELILALLNKELESQKFFLEVRKSNEKAINLYKHFGFNVISERKKYYPNGEDAFVMLLERI